MRVCEDFLEYFANMQKVRFFWLFPFMRRSLIKHNHYKFSWKIITVLGNFSYIHHILDDDGTVSSLLGILISGSYKGLHLLSLKMNCGLGIFKKMLPVLYFTSTCFCVHLCVYGKKSLHTIGEQLKYVYNLYHLYCSIKIALTHNKNDITFKSNHADLFIDQLLFLQSFSC